MTKLSKEAQELLDEIELAERCEAGRGPDRELDGDIHALLVGAPHRHQIPSTWPFYTASLDAAKTLWPGEVPHLIPSDPRICTAMALRAIASQEQGEKQ